MNYFDNINKCPLCLRDFGKKLLYAGGAGKKCIDCYRYIIYKDDLLGIEECRKIKKYTLTYLHDRDITYFHDVPGSTLESLFNDKSILFSLSGNFLLNEEKDLEVIIKNALIIG